MPAKRVIILDKISKDAPFYRYVLWADVPVVNQIAYRNPLAISVYQNVTPVEIQAIRDGLVAEKSGTFQADSATIAQMQTSLETEWTNWQAEISTLIPWGDYGRSWNGTIWTASLGVPTIGSRDLPEGIPSYIALTPVSAFAANKFHFVLHNAASAMLGQSLIIKIRLVVIIPGQAVVTGVSPSTWTLQKRIGIVTPPAGGAIAISALDTAFGLSSSIAAYNAPVTSPAGGSTITINQFVPQADEVKLSTLDAPTTAALFSNWGGQVIYKASDIYPARPLTIRAGESCEVIQSATAGTGNAQVLCAFTIG